MVGRSFLSSSYHCFDQYQKLYSGSMDLCSERLQWGRKARAPCLWMALCGRVWGRGDVWLLGAAMMSCRLRCIAVGRVPVSLRQHHANLSPFQPRNSITRCCSTHAHPILTPAHTHSRLNTTHIPDRQGNPTLCTVSNRMDLLWSIFVATFCCHYIHC